MSETAASASTHIYDYDLIVIGGGSGGVSTAKRSATLYNQKVAIIESLRWGGTCVNVGCVPKKIMYQTAHIYETLLHDTKHYRISTGLSDTEKPKFDWTAFKHKRDAYIVRLNNIYLNGLASAGVTRLEGWGSFVDHHTIQVKKHDGTEEILTAKYILIAVGGKPFLPTNGNDGVHLDNVMSSDEFFNTLEVQPTKAVVVGAGYIAVEIAGVLASLGTDTHLIIRKEKALRSFDDDISNRLNDLMTNHTSNLTIHRNTNGIKNVSNDTNTNLKTVTTISNDIIVDNADIVLMAPGRIPNIDKLNLPSDIQMKTDASGGCVDEYPYIYVDEYQNTSVSNIFAIGDVCGEVELTPMAIAAGRRLSDRLFSNDPLLKNIAKTSYENVPTIVFSHPPIGTIGLTEHQAINKYGKDNIKIYTSTFVNLYYSMYDMEPSDKPKTFIKIICVGIEEYIIGLHMIGKDVDEVLQGFGVAIKMNATKADFDNCIAIHPTAAEEVVTAGVWGTSSLYTGATHSTLLGRPAATPTLLHPLPTNTNDPSSKI